MCSDNTTPVGRSKIELVASQNEVEGLFVSSYVQWSSLCKVGSYIGLTWQDTPVSRSFNAAVHGSFFLSLCIPLYNGSSTIPASLGVLRPHRAPAYLLSPSSRCCCQGPHPAAGKVCHAERNFLCRHGADKSRYAPFVILAARQQHTCL